MRRVVVCLVATLLSGCALDPFVLIGGDVAVGDWLIEQNVDPITGIAVPSARVFTIRASSANEEYFAKAADLQLTCSGKDPIVKFSYDFKVGSTLNSILGYRFDERPGRDKVDVRFLLSARTIVIEQRPAVIQFLKDMEGAKRLYVRTRSLTLGRTVTEFDITGSAQAIKAAYAGCLSDAELARPVS